jgi:hypothetical protein
MIHRIKLVPSFHGTKKRENPDTNIANDTNTANDNMSILLSIIRIVMLVIHSRKYHWPS